MKSRAAIHLCLTTTVFVNLILLEYASRIRIAFLSEKEKFNIEKVCNMQQETTMKGLLLFFILKAVV